MSETRDPVERTIEVLVYAPIGVGMMVKDMAPSVVETLVARGRAEVDRRGTEIGTRVTTARSLGQVALAFGVPMLRQRVQTRIDDVLARANRTGAPAPAGSDAPQTEPTPAPAIIASVPEPVPAPDIANTNGSSNGSTSDTAADDGPQSADLPIPGYDALSASQVVERLSGLGREELDVVHAYEAAHRQRRTVLGKIEQLAG